MIIILKVVERYIIMEVSFVQHKEIAMYTSLISISASLMVKK